MLFKFGGVFRKVWNSALILGTLVIGANTLFVAPVSAATGINQQLNFQGRLLNAQGAVVVDGYYNVQFKIYQDGTGAAAGNPGGTLKWTEDWLNSAGNGIKIVNGYMSVQLGSLNPFGNSIDWNQDTIWLSVNIGNINTSCAPFTSCGGDGEMLPMKRLSAVPYALNAAKLGGLTAAGFIQNTTTVQTATNMAIDGTARADTGILTPYIDTNTATALNIGTTNATSINLNQNVTVAAGKTLTLAGGSTASRPSSPTEGMMWYDTTTKQLLVYANGKWQSDKNSSTKIVAASNASQALKDGADYVATGTSDQGVINSALTAAAGGKVYLTEGTFTINGSISIPNNTTLAGAGSGTVITIPNALNTSFSAIVNTDQTTGAGITIQDLSLDGNKANQSGAVGMAGLNLNTVGTSGRQGAKVQNLRAYNWYNSGSTGVNCQFGVGICIRNSSNSSITSSTAYGNGTYGISLIASTSNAVTGNTAQGNSSGGILIWSNSHNNAVTGNTAQGNNIGIRVDGSNGNTVAGNTAQGNYSGIMITYNTNNNAVTGNTAKGNGNYGIYLSANTGTTTVSGNNLSDNGGTTNNNAIYLDASSNNNNSITGNVITDSSATTTNYAINIQSGSTSNYLADNTLGGGTVNDLGTGTIYAGQYSSTTNFLIQPASNITIGSASTITSLQGAVGVNTTNPQSQFEVKSAGGVSSGTVTMTATSGSGTFTTSSSMTLNKGDLIIPTTTTGEAKTIATTATGTSFSTVSNFGANVTAETFTVYKPTANFTDSNGTSQLMIRGNGAVSIGNCFSNDSIKFNICGASAFNGSIYATSLYNYNSAGNAAVLLQTTGTNIRRDVADANTALTVTQANAGSTGNILELKNSTGTVASVTNGGDLKVASTIDTQTATALNIGTSSATAINLNQNVTVASGKSLTLTGGSTASRPASPTEGMMWYDTDTKQLLTYSNGKWQADRNTATKVVAASNASQALKDGADYVATGTGDQGVINSALTAAAGGKVYLTEGTYTVNASISIPNNTTLAGAGAGTVITVPNAFNTTINAVTNTTTGGNGTGVTIQDLTLDGNKANQTSGDMVGIYFNGVGSSSGSSAVQGGKIINVSANNWYGSTGYTGTGIYLTASSNNTITNSYAKANSRQGIVLTSNSNRNTLTGDVAEGGIVAGVYLNASSNNNIANIRAYAIQLLGGSNNNTVTGSTLASSGNGVVITSSTNNTITNNIITNNTNGVRLITATANTISGNNFVDNGNSTDNNAVLLDASSSNTITGNTIADSSATSTNYAINISNSTSDNNYLADNVFNSTPGTSTINDLGTGTIYSNQARAENGGKITNRTANDTEAFTIQNAAGSNLFTADTANSQIILQGSQDTPVLGSELVTSQDFSNATYWTCSTGWTTTTTTAQHNTGNSNTCAATASNFAVTAGTRYEITWTISGRTLAGIAASIGGVSGSSYYSNGVQTAGITATSTSPLTFTPEANFDGTISAISVKAVTGTSKPVLSVKDQSGTVRLELRATANVTALGLGSLQYNTSGTNNTALGSASLQNNTTGFNNTASGTNSLRNNTTGYANTANGNVSLYNNTVGAGNTGSGYASLNSNTTGSYNTGSGYASLYGNTTGNYNSGLGFYAGYSGSQGNFKTLNNLQYTTTLGAYSQAYANNTLTLGGQGNNAVNIGIGTGLPTNRISGESYRYSTGTVTTNATATVVGTGTTFTNDMVGNVIYIATNSTSTAPYMRTITAVTDATHITVSSSVPALTDAQYYINYVGIQMTTTGNFGINSLNPQAQLEVRAQAGVPSGTITMTATRGTGTFTTSSSMTLNRGDWIVPTTSTSQGQTIATTATGTSFSTMGVYSANITAETFTVYKPTTNITASDGTSQFMVQGNGNINIGNGTNNSNLKLYVNGTSAFNGSIWATTFNNFNTADNSQLRLLSTGTAVNRNIADSNSALTVQQQNASSTGNILTLQNSGGTVASFSQAGNLYLGSLLDTTAATGLSLGTANASSITIGKAGVTTTILGNLGVTLNGTAGTTITCQNASGYLSVCDSSVLTPSATNFIQNQNSAQQTSANFWISGAARSDTSVLTPLVDTAAAGTLSIGTTNATSIALNQNVTVAAGKSLTLAGGSTASRPASPTEGMMWYDTTTKQLLTYANGKWQSDAKTATKIVAASNASQALKDGADYVATGTGDQSTINSALTAAAGGKVYLTEGTYTLSASISMPVKTQLAGAGSGTLIQLANFGATSTDIDAIAATTVDGTGYTIRDLKLDGRRSVNTAGTQRGIFLNYVARNVPNGATIDNVAMGNFRTEGMQIQESGHITISDSNFYSNGGDGLYINYGSHDFTITNSIFRDNVDKGLRMDDSNGAIDGSSFTSNGGVGIYVHGGDNTVTNNVVSSNGNDGIFVHQSDRTLVSGNTVRSNTGIGIEVADGVDYSSINSNNVYSNSSYGIALTWASTNDTISGNEIYDNGGATNNDGILIDYSSNNNSITNNKITDTSCTSTCYAIRISNSSSANYLSDNSLGGGTLNDGGIGTVYGGQYASTTSYLLQPATNITVGSASTTTTLLGNTAVTLSATTGTTMVCQNGSSYLSACDSSVLMPTAGNFIRNTTTQQTNANINIAATSGTVAADIQGASGQNIMVLRNSSGAGALYIDSGGNLYGGGIYSSINNTASSTAATFKSGNSTTSGNTGDVTLQSGNATSGNSGNVNIDAGSASGTKGSINIGTTNAAAINLNQNVTVASGKSLTLAGGSTASRPASPTEGMMWYDTTTKQLLTYSNGKWQSDRNTATKVVAAYNATQALKDGADYVATGTNDQAQINAALTAAAGGKVYLTEGTFTIGGSISVPNNTTLAGAGAGTVITVPNNFNTDINAITNTITGGNGTGVTVQDLRLEGNKANQTAGSMKGIFFNGVGSGSGASAIPGGKIANISVGNWRDVGILFDSSSNNSVTGNTVQGDLYGILVYNSTSNIITSNVTQGNANYGIYLISSSKNTVIGNIANDNASYGIYLNSSSNNNRITGNTVQSNSYYGIYLNSSSMNTITGNAANGSTMYGIYLNSSSSNLITGNTANDNTDYGIYLGSSSNNNSVTSNAVKGNGSGINITASSNNTLGNNTADESVSYGIYLLSSSKNTITANKVSSNSIYGIYIYGGSSYNVISSNTLSDNGGSTDNNAIYLSGGVQNNSITGNSITDSSATATNYAINLQPTGITSNYLADNTLGGGTVNDAGTGTIYGGQSNGTTYNIQPAQNITVGSASTTTTLQGNTAVTLNAATGTVMVCRNVSGYLSSCDAGYLAPTATNFIQNQIASVQTANSWINGTARADTNVLTPSLDTASGIALSIGTGNATGITLGKGGVATTAAGGLLTSSVDAASIAALTIGNTNASSISIGKSSISTNLSSSTINVGTSGSTTTIAGAAQTTTGNAGNAMVIQGSTGLNGNGGTVTVQGGNANGTGTLGGNLTLAGGTGSTSNGTVILATSTFQTATTDSNCFPSGSESTSTSNCTIAQSSINNNAAVIVGFTNDGQTAFMPDPSILTAGRVVYVTASNGSKDFTLSVNGGGQGNQIAMRKNTTATMIWNGADWTAAGASSSTTMQAAYDNTLQSAGGAELVVSKTSATNGLTIRDSSVNSVNGALLTVQSSSAANLFSVNSNVTEYTSNSGAETYSGTTTTFPASTWTLLNGATVTRNTTTANIATGQGSAQVVTSSSLANSGVKNVLNTALTPSQHYNVSFSAKLSSGTFTDLAVYYSVDGSANTVQCATGQAIKTSVWTKINCAFTAPTGTINATNSINIVQGSTGTARTFYVDNISVTIAADYNYATDGNVDDNTNFATNWPYTTGIGTGSTTRNASDGYNASSSAGVTIGTGAANAGLRNKLSINPLVSTLYRVSVYAKLSSGTFTDFKVRYSPDGGTNYVDCADYNTQTVTTSAWTQITCYVTTGATAVSNPYVYFVETASAARTFYVDAFSMTLASNTTPNVQVGSGSNGGPTTLFTLDKGASAPIAANNDALLGSMYYDTTLGKLQCYEADGWGACGSSPDNIVTISPEYTNAVLHGPSVGTTGVGTMTSDLCSDTLNINDSGTGTTICGTNETYNFYKWTSPQATAQTYAIYVTYQLPSTFKSFASGVTSIMGRTDNGLSGGAASVSYKIFRNSSSGLTQCGSAVSVSSGTVAAWQIGTAAGAADPSTCGFAPGDSILFEIDMTANRNANAYVGNLGFTFSNK